jgi:RHS repeat-associated protein
LLLLSTSFQATADKVTYVHTDVLGSPVAETDESGNIIWTEHYSPFGEKVDNSEESIDNSVGYTGHQYDSDTGLTYMQARYYDPVIGRFYSNDPVGFTGNIHTFGRYTYGNNNPYKYVDPDGRSSIEANMFANMFGFQSSEQATTSINGSLEKGRQAVLQGASQVNKASGTVGGLATAAAIVCTAVCQPAVPVLTEIAIASTVTGVVTSDAPLTEGVKALVTAGAGNKVDVASDAIKAVVKGSDTAVDVAGGTVKKLVGDEISSEDKVR